MPRRSPFKGCTGSRKQHYVSGCHCIRCDERRAYVRQWRKDQQRLRTESHRRRLEQYRRKYHRERDARLMYVQLRALMARDEAA